LYGSLIICKTVRTTKPTISITSKTPYS
jgi:hypothetical protein